MNNIFPIKPAATSSLKGLYCLDPFASVSIELNGDVRLCSCWAWMPTVVGNIQQQTIKEILNNDLSHRIRQSIRDGTYDYCNKSRCGIINNNRLLTLDEISDDHIGGFNSLRDRVIDTSVVEMPRQITITGDLICNLSCPSCRTKLITESDEEKVNRRSIIEMINKNLFSGSDPHPITIYFGLGGEFFASPLLLDFLKNFPLDRYPRPEFKLTSNGLLLKKRWNRIKHLEKHIVTFTISADSQDPTTYRKLRRGGELSDLMENLEFMSRLKKELGFEFILRMVVQQDNATETHEFFDFAMKYNADLVEYQFLINKGTFNDAEYHALNVLRSDHALHDRTINDLRSLRDQHKEKVVIYHGII